MIFTIEMISYQAITPKMRLPPDSIAAILIPSCMEKALTSSTGSIMPHIIYKIAEEPLWRQAEKTGVFKGAPIDVKDGYIHFSTGDQVAQTAALHFAGQPDLVLVAVDGARLGNALLYEESRGGALFPHLYGPLPLSAVVWSKPLMLDDNNKHILPDLV